MSEPETGKNQPHMALHKIFIKDLSFESPKAAEFFANPPANPEVNLQLNTEIQKLSDTFYEITLKINVRATIKGSDRTIYLVELKQAGLFALSNFSANEFAYMTNTFCPNILFPYAREAISSMVERGGFPQFLLAPINFEALYQEHLSRSQQSAAPAESETAH
jgi:preprotein translocase subunit SecB